MHEGRKVWVLDDLSSGTLDNLEARVRKSTIKLVRGDVRKRQLVGEPIPNIDSVIHLAAITDHDICLQNPELVNDVNANNHNFSRKTSSTSLFKVKFIETGGLCPISLLR